MNLAEDAEGLGVGAVEFAGDEAFVVDGDGSEAQGEQGGVELGGEGLEGCDLVGGDFEACGGGVVGAVVADAADVEAQGLDGGLGGFDALEFFEGHRLPVGDAGAEAGRGGLVPDGEVQAFGPVADGGFIDLQVGEGSADGAFVGGLDAGAVVGGVVGVLAVEHPPAGELVGDGAQVVVEGGLAEVAAVDGVAGVVGVLEFGGGDDAEGDVVVLAEADPGGEVAAFEAGRVGHDGEGAVAAEGAAGEDGDEGAIDAGGEGDDRAGAIGEPVGEPGL